MTSGVLSPFLAFLLSNRPGQHFSVTHCLYRTCRVRLTSTMTRQAIVQLLTTIDKTQIRCLTEATKSDQIPPTHDFYRES